MYEIQLVEQYLNDEQPDVRKAGVGILANSSIKNAETLLIRGMADSSDIVWQMARDVLIHRQPWLLLRPFMTRTVPQKALQSKSGILWQSLRTGIQKWLMLNNNPGTKVLRRYLQLPGAVPDIIDGLRAAENQPLAEWLVKESDLFCEYNNKTKQILFAPTYACNLNCSYCYAKEWDSFFNKECTLNDLNKLFFWLKKQGINLMILAGGEPTVYTHFIELLKLAKKNNIKVRLTTNALYSKKIREFIQPEFIEEIITHYDQSLIGDLHRHTLFLENLENAKASGLDLLFRYTLTDQSNTSEWNTILSLVCSFDIPVIHYACSFQNYQANNQTLRFQLNATENLFEKTLCSFIDECRSRDLQLHLCKPIPLCSLSEERLKQFLINSTLRSACAAYLRHYSQNVTVNPDLSTFPCNAIPFKGPLITSFNQINESGDYYSQLLKQLLYQPYNENCNDCFFFFRGFCQGSCLAEKFSMNNFNGSNNVLQSQGSI